VLLHMANLAEQQPVTSRLLSRLSELAELLHDSDVVTLPGFAATLEALSEAGPAPPSAGGPERFHRYLEALSGSPRAPYPELPAEPWHDPQDFPLARYLEGHAAEIREEVLALDPGRFHRESERIERTGDWDVAFFYERGRRHDAACEACPVTAAGIEDPLGGAVLTSAGLIYASRMRPGTHIQPHRGPTNLRLRCHLGIQVPEGDCAIRVGDETRAWEPGRCLVFDDHFEHEAWNRTGEDRLVLIVDVWHPALSAEEIRLLAGLHRHVEGHARRLAGYWRANAAAAAGG
jgi:aspartate beta-hydroxylase